MYVDIKGQQCNDVTGGLVGIILFRTHGQFDYSIVFDAVGLAAYFWILWKKSYLGKLS